MPLRLAILILSAAAIAYEVLLIRLLSIIQWQQFAAMIISLALLGYGASGSVLALIRDRLLKAPSNLPGRLFLLGAASFAPLSVGAFLLAQRLPFNPLALVWEPVQLLWLLLVYLVLAVPFFSAGFSIGLVLMMWRAEISRIYRADLLGAGIGASGIVLALWAAPPERCLLLVGGGGLLAAAAASLDRRVDVSRAVTALLVGAVLWLAALEDGPGLRLSEYKSLSKTLQVPGTEIVARRSSPLALLTVVRSPQIPFRYAPGLSLSYAGDLPEQLGLFLDGDSMTAINRDSRAGGRDSFRQYQILSLVYRFQEEPQVLVLGLGSGEGVARALANGARKVITVETDRRLVELLKRDLAEFSGRLLEAPEVAVETGDVRSFLASNRDSWDVIDFSEMQSAIAASGGVGAAGVSYLYTVEAFAAMADRLAPGGVLSVTHWLRLPPRDSLKLFATAVEALESLGWENPESSLAMMRNWDVVTLLVKRGGWTSSELESLRVGCRTLSFDLVFLPDLSLEEANRFNQLEQPYLAQGTMALAGKGREEFYREYKFVVRPASDSRPFFAHFFRWRALPELVELRERGGASLLEWGYLVVVGTLLQALVVGALLILTPLALRREKRLVSRRSSRWWVYFAALGVAFLMLEIAYIQRVTLYLGDPILAVAVALAAFLCFAGLGSGASSVISRRAANGSRSGLGFVLGWIVLFCLLHLGLTPLLFESTLAASLGYRLVISIVMVAPLAFAMGMPFPLALQRLAELQPGWIPWAWGINGWATVVSAALAPLLAVHLGLDALVVFAAVCYGLAGWASSSLCR